MTDRYCVIGNPVAHSKSPEIHAAFAAQTGQHLHYERVVAPTDGFAATVRALIADGFRGANVTLPFKLDACALATTLSARARAAGAVNTLCFKDGGIIGDNTDGAGLVADILSGARVPLAGARVLLLGAGGAARGVMLPLLERGLCQLVVANRTHARARALVRMFEADMVSGQRISAVPFDQLTGAFDIIVNATSASLQADLPPVPPDVFGGHTLALDMMYGSTPTVFMRAAQRLGATPRDGLGMLVEQAAEAFFIWRGVRPDGAAVLARLREAL